MSQCTHPPKMICLTDITGLKAAPPLQYQEWPLEKNRYIASPLSSSYNTSLTAAAAAASQPSPSCQPQGGAEEANSLISF